MRDLGQGEPSPKSNEYRDDRPAVLAHRIENAAAVVVFGLPLAYLLTEHSYAPLIGPYSARLMTAIAAYAVLVTIALWSYRRRMPRWVALGRRSVVSVGAWTVAAVVVVELGFVFLDARPRWVDVELLRGYQADPDVGYVLIPNYRQTVVSMEYTTDWATNAEGVRALRDYGSKPDGVVRILGLGDSFTASVSTPQEDTWTSVLEARLRTIDADRFEVINAGLPGYGTMQSLAWLRKYGLAFEPDIVLLAMTPNDIGDNSSPPPGYFTAVDGYLAQRGANEAHRIRYEHRLQWWSVPGWIQRSRVRRELRSLVPQPVPAALMPFAEDLNQRWQRNHELTRRYLLDLRDETRSAGAGFGVVLIAFRTQLMALPEGYSPETFGRRWSDFATAYDIPVIDMYPTLRDHHDPQSLFWRWDNHYNAEGQRLTGEQAFQLVRDRFLAAPRATQ